MGFSASIGSFWGLHLQDKALKQVHYSWTLCKTMKLRVERYLTEINYGGLHYSPGVPFQSQKMRVLRRESIIHGYWQKNIEARTCSRDNQGWRMYSLLGKSNEKNQRLGAGSSLFSSRSRLSSWQLGQEVPGKPHMIKKDHFLCRRVKIRKKCERCG